ncbi:biotin--[acetyl-CoA-carboxylase] ligase [Butyrivibrio sp. AE3004]|uniref:biotin--[acetyl-CoA-carboxylase] ligase n=1 Tax=Butyrivibrio sp. AE3004 TaxID=1506994 RepID=UPI00068D86FB|nr:biotin--[acetyl-CoA-carboxylase] ligase [Butyrivibrio sp. AE3004]
MPGTKEKVLDYLENNRGKFSSGEAIANELNISRNSVWKAIESLRRDGFLIEASSRRGYFLSERSDKLTLSGISSLLNDDIDPNLIQIFDSIDSTNKAAKQKAIQGCPHGYTVIALKQTNGTGKRKSSFTSPDGGIYMSFVLKPEELHISNSQLITPFTAVSICKVLEKDAYLSPSIKWMNDIYLSGKKVCGILAEISADFDTGDIQYIVIGVGIYFNNDEKCFPADQKERIGAVFKRGEESITKNEFVAGLINELLSNNTKDDSEILSEYRSRLNMLSKDITVISGADTYKAKALDVDENAKLIVELPDKTKKVLFSEIIC